MDKHDYANPPVVEAILDFIADDSPLSKADVIQGLEKFGTEFGLEKSIALQQTTANIGITEGGQLPTLTQEQEVIGYRFSNGENTIVISARHNGLSISFLKPYPGWETVEALARQVLPKYLSIAQHKKIIRIGIRYINRIELPGGFDDFSEYLQTYPQVGSELPQGLAGMFFRVVIPNPAAPDMGVVTLGMDEAGLSPQLVPVILDIDAFRPAAIGSDDSEGLWRIVKAVRTYRTQLFEGSITDKARELFK